MRPTPKSFLFGLLGSRAPGLGFEVEAFYLGDGLDHNCVCLEGQPSMTSDQVEKGLALRLAQAPQLGATPFPWLPLRGVRALPCRP